VVKNYSQVTFIRFAHSRPAVERAVKSNRKMPIPPPLTQDQTKKLAVLEPRLKLCVRSANLYLAKQLTAEIQLLLKPTGHETRLLQAKNWLYETAMEANSITFAKLGFEGSIKKALKGQGLISKLHHCWRFAICEKRT
jgi:hypothetical protein